jgi:hypothetical protein
VELPCRFCGELFPRDFNEGFTDNTTGRYHYIVGPALIRSEDQYFHPSGRRMGRRNEKKKRVVTEETESE